MTSATFTLAQPKRIRNTQIDICKDIQILCNGMVLSHISKSWYPTKEKFPSHGDENLKIVDSIEFSALEYSHKKLGWNRAKFVILDFQLKSVHYMKMISLYDKLYMNHVLN